MVLVGIFLSDLINYSERASKLIRLIREQNNLFKYLIEEKDDESKNERFKHDFKTISDVLIQQLLIYLINRKYPEISPIKGEENNKFTNVKGVTIEIKITDNKLELENMLINVLADVNVVKSIINIIYDDLNCNTNELDNYSELFEEDIDVKEIGVYIDPIDCTNEYVKGDHLECVTCLIGIYMLETGNSKIGIISFPFYNYKSDRKGKYIWGICYKNICLNSINQIGSNSKSSKKIIALSSSENQKIIDKLSDSYELIYYTGLGYKLYLVLINQVDAFLLSKATSFKWDTCAASAIFRSIKNSYLIELMNSINKAPLDDLTKYELNYNSNEFANKNGLLACKDLNLLNEILIKLRN